MKRSVLPVVITVLVMAFFYIPIVVLVINSFNASSFGGNWEGFTLKWYGRLLHEKEILRAFENSMIIGICSTLVSSAIGTMAAYALHRYEYSRLQKIHYGLISVPLVIPEVLTGISLLLFFVAIRLDLGLFTIFLSHVTFCISYVTMVVLARLQDFDFSIVEAARDLGADMKTAILRVLIPNIAPGILAGALLAFTLSIDDFIISFFVAGPGATTLPIRIYSMMKHGSPALINVLSTILLVITLSLVVLSQWIMKRKDNRL